MLGTAPHTSGWGGLLGCPGRPRTQGTPRRFPSPTSAFSTGKQLSTGRPRLRSLGLVSVGVLLPASGRTRTLPDRRLSHCCLILYPIVGGSSEGSALPAPCLLPAGLRVHPAAQHAARPGLEATRHLGKAALGAEPCAARLKYIPVWCEVLIWGPHARAVSRRAVILWPLQPGGGCTWGAVSGASEGSAGSAKGSGLQRLNLAG